MKLLITGISGTGKSTLAKALSERGVTAIDLHDIPGLFFWQDKETKATVEYKPVHSVDWFDHVDRLCDIEMLKGILSQYGNVIAAGSTSGTTQNEFLSLFDKVILLQCDPTTVVHRMETRTNKSGFGKTKAEQEDNIEWQKEFDPFLISQGAIPITTNRPINDVVEDILKYAAV